MLNYGEISLKRPRHNFCAGTRDAGDRRDRVGACRPADGARWRVRFRAREPRGLERVDDMRRAGGAADSHSEMNSDSLRFILYSEARLIQAKNQISIRHPAAAKYDVPRGRGRGHAPWLPCTISTPSPHGCACAVVMAVALVRLSCSRRQSVLGGADDRGATFTTLPVYRLSRGTPRGGL